MNTFLITLIFISIILSIGLVGMAVKVLFKKNGEFPGTCASNSPFLNKEGENCVYCGASPEEKCKK